MLKLLTSFSVGIIFFAIIVLLFSDENIGKTIRSKGQLSISEVTAGKLYQIIQQDDSTSVIEEVSTMKQRFLISSELFKEKKIHPNRLVFYDTNENIMKVYKDGNSGLSD